MSADVAVAWPAVISLFVGYFIGVLVTRWIYTRDLD